MINKGAIISSRVVEERDVFIYGMHVRNNRVIRGIINWMVGFIIDSTVIKDKIGRLDLVAVTVWVEMGEFKTIHAFVVLTWKRSEKGFSLNNIQSMAIEGT